MEKNNKAKRDIAQDCYDYMSTSAGREKVLNPPDRTPIARVNWGTTEFEKEIEARVDLYVEIYLQSDGVLKRYERLRVEIDTFCEQVISNVSEMEKEWIEILPDIWYLSPTNPLLLIDILTSSVWMAALAIGFGLAAAVFSGISFLFNSVFGWFIRKTDEDINKEYNKNLAKIKEKICDHLDINCGVVIKKLINKVTEDILPKKLRTFETMIQQISETKEKITANQKRLKGNAVKIRNMEDNVIKLSGCLNS